MKLFAPLTAALFLSAAAFCPVQAAPGTFSLESILAYPYPLHLVSGADGHMIAYVLNERGVRNVFVANAPDYKPRNVTGFTADDGQELTNLSISRDGKYVVFVRGGDHDSNWPPAFPPDPAANTVAPQMEIWSVALRPPGKAVVIGDGDAPAISPDNRRVAFIAPDNSVSWTLLDGSGKADKLFFDEGQDSDLEWSPDGTRLAFVSTRTDHSFIGIYHDANAPLRFLSPSTSQDVEPRWSPDGTRIAFLRTPGSGGPPATDFAWTVMPWGLWIGDAGTGSAHRIWESANTLRASFPDDFDPSLRWTAADRLTFLTHADNWAHLYSIAPDGGTPKLLTPGHYMVEDTAASTDGRSIVFSANTGGTKGDFDRRHLFRADVAGGDVRELTGGTSSEWGPAATAGGIAFIQAGSRVPPLVTVAAANGGALRAIDRDRLPANFPTAQLIVPRSVTFRGSDGQLTHGQIFEAAGGARKPAVVFVHGGPPRQMLSTWHYMDYYTNGYAVNQYLANHGFVVLSLNYRLGIGFGYAYAHPDRWGPTGASEYNDVLGANAYLRSLPGVDGRRIGIWGGSYGGYLTALALARNSNLFCTGVDWHGVHDWSSSDILPDPPARYQLQDMKQERRIAWESSPDSSIAKWRSPVLLVQGDDDHNVRFHQTVDLARRLDLAGVPYGELVIPNEIHGFLRHATFLQADNATVDFLRSHLTQSSCR